MKFLLDTHVLLCVAGVPERLSAEARMLLDDPENALLFSPASLWEVAIKRGLKRDDFQVDPRILRRGLLDNDCQELPIRSERAVAIAGLLAIHKDPFARVLVAQSLVEGIILLISDPIVAQRVRRRRARCVDVFSNQRRNETAAQRVTAVETADVQERLNSARSAASREPHGSHCGLYLCRVQT